MDIENTPVEATVTTIETALNNRRRKQIYKIAAKVAVIAVPIAAVLYFLTKDKDETIVEITTEN